MCACAPPPDKLAPRMSNEPANPALKELRQRLNQVDDDMVRLLAKRLETVGLIAKAKAGSTQAIRDPEREREVLARVETLAQSLGCRPPWRARSFPRSSATRSVARWPRWLGSREHGRRSGSPFRARP